MFGPEICNNGLDDDGDGKVDEGCICKPGAMQDCFPDVARLAGVGTCTMGKQPCEGDQEFGGWGRCVGAVTPAGEACDGLDNDCDGVVDDGCAVRGRRQARLLFGVRRARSASAPAVTACRRASAAPAASAASGARASATCGPTATCATASTTIATAPSTTAARAARARPAPATAASRGTESHAPCKAGTRIASRGPTAPSGGRVKGRCCPGAELCDRVDNDCDGTVDDGCACTPGAKRACYGGPAGTRGVGRVRRRLADVHGRAGRRRQRLGAVRRRRGCPAPRCATTSTTTATASSTTAASAGAARCAAVTTAPT